MTKKMLGVFTSVVAALAVVGVAWAGTGDGTSASVMAAGETSTDASIEDSSSSTEATIASSTDATVASSTEATVDSTSTSIDDRDDDDDTTTSTTIESTTSTSIDDRDDDDDTTTSTTIESTTSTSIDDSDERTVPDGVSTHIVPGVGTVTVEVKSDQLALVSVTAPGWTLERQRVEADRIELEFTGALDAEAEFEARLGSGRLEIETEVDSD